MTNNLIPMLNDAYFGEKYSIAKIISEIERKDNFEFRTTLFEELKNRGTDQNAISVGITGTPGAGKSSLLGEICKIFLEMAPNKKMAIVAIDPSSNISGGSILGDRTRVALPRRENRIYFRSQPSQLELGGLNPYTYHVIRFLRYLFDFVFIETVGIGQNEISVSLISDLSFLVMQPLGGDQVQFMKSGIMEVPDAFIINKCDEENLANSSYHMLETTLSFLKDILPDQSLPPIFKTSVIKHTGIKDVLDFILAFKRLKNRNSEAKQQLEKWIESEYGIWGKRILNTHNLIQKNMSPPSMESNLSYEQLEGEALRLIKSYIKE